jgi:hypothetical protein
MKKWHWVGATGAVALGVASMAYAASIENLSGQSCGASTGNWHFINNQTGGAPAGTLMATWSSGNTCTVSASAVNNKTQHFNCIASGTLVSAVTNLPGRLVLSDFSCGTLPPPPPPPPPPCDPKTDPKCEH